MMNTSKEREKERQRKKEKIRTNTTRDMLLLGPYTSVGYGGRGSRN